MDPKVIELDLGTPWEPSPRRGRPPAHLFRWLALGLAAVVAATSLVAAAPERSLAPDVVVPGPVRLLGLGDDLMYVTGTGDSARRITAYRVVDGAPAWSAEAPGPVIVATPVDGDLLVTYGHEDPIGTERLSGRTGATVWDQRRGFPNGGDHGTLFLAGLSAVGPGAQIVTTEDGGYLVRDFPRRLTAVDPLTGATRWTLDLPEGGRVTVATATGTGQAEPPVLAVVTVDPDGATGIREPGTGEVRRRFAVTPPDAASPVVTVGSTLVVRAGGGLLAHAYDLDSGRELWSGPATADGFLVACGPYACGSGSAGTVAVDLASGRERWRLPGWQTLDEVGPNRVLAVRADGSDDPRQALVDPRTGRIERDLGGWRLVGDPLRRGGLAYSRGQRGEGVVARYDPTTGAARMIGRPGDWYATPDCAGNATVVVCTGAQRLALWRLDRRTMG